MKLRFISGMHRPLLGDIFPASSNSILLIVQWLRAREDCPGSPLAQTALFAVKPNSMSVVFTKTKRIRNDARE